MRRWLALIGLSTALVVLAPAPADACTCAPIGPPCQQVWESPLVFVGTVIAIEQRDGAFDATKVRLRVTEAFRGNEAGEIDIHLRGSGGASCDPTFEMGESWLVYGNNRWDGKPGWTTSICSRTRRLSEAEEDLAYLRLPNDQKPRSHIKGRVQDVAYRPYPSREIDTVGIPNVPVSVRRGSTLLETKTDSEGRYRFDVSDGVYEVSFGPVSGIDIRGGRSVALRHHLACATVDAHVVYEGRVTGQVVDARGVPVPFLPLQMASTAQRSLEHTLTDVTGRFDFPVWRPAPHEVALSTDLWPTEPDVPPLTPEPLDNPNGGALDAGQLRLPDGIDLAIVELMIVDSAGNPASGADVHFRLPEIYNATSYDPWPQADDRGRFLVSLIAGERYEFSISYPRKTPSDTVLEEATVIVEANGAPVRVRLAPWRY